MKRQAMLELIVVVSIFLCGCQWRPITKTGFLSDYSRLETVSETGLRYINRNALARYSSFIVEPIDIQYVDIKAINTATDQDITKQDIANVADYLQQAIIKELSSGYEIASRPGPAIARIRMAITDLRKTRRVAESHGHGGYTALEGIRARAGGISIEAEIVDSETDEQIAAVVELHFGRAPQDWSDWSDAEAGMDYWARQLHTRIDEAHQR
jgi:hypothetical protein